MIQLIDRRLLDDLSATAATKDRLRQNHNFHGDYTDPCQRLLNALEPGTYVRPHRHTAPPKPEGFVALRGRMAAVIFSEAGAIEQAVVFAPQSEVVGLDLGAGVWHGILALEPGSIFYETKPGPYLPMSDKDWAPWAPPEAAPEAASYLRQLEEKVRSLIAEGRG